MKSLKFTGSGIRSIKPPWGCFHPALDKLGWVHEGQADYLKNAAAVYMEFTHDGTDLDCCLAVSPTWEENRLLTREIRSGLKEKGLLPMNENACRFTNP